jgi:hypothetical protein
MSNQTTCKHCGRVNCIDRYISLSYSFKQSVTLEWFAGEIAKVIASSGLKVRRYVVLAFEETPWIKAVWMDLDAPPIEMNEIQNAMILRAGARQLDRLPTPNRCTVCWAVVQEIEKLKKRLAAEDDWKGYAAVAKEVDGGMNGHLSKFGLNF